VTLRDGDRIIVPEASEQTPAESTQIAEANFSPETIQVSLVGEVKSPGRIQVEPNTPLNQALLASGGFDRGRADEGEVHLIRLQKDGTVTRREIPVDFSEGISFESNPTLRDGDIVVAERNTLTKVSDTVSNIFRPFTSIFSVFRTFDFLFGN